MTTQLKQAWQSLEGFQRLILVGAFFLFPLGLFFPPIMEFLMLPLALLSCVGGS